MRFTDINVNTDIEIGEYSNRKITLCMASTKKPVRFQIPRMYIPFGVSGFTPEVGPTKWNVDFSMKGWDEENNYVKKFYDFLKALERRIIDHAMQGEIGSKLSEGMFNSNIKPNGDFEPKFRVKVDTDVSGFLKPRIFDVNENDVTCDAENGLYSKHSAAAIVELNSVYFLNKMFGITWKLHQMKVYEPQRLKGFQFKIEDGDEDGFEETCDY